MNRLPEWLRKKTPKHFFQKEIRALINDHEVHSVCEEARCPNRGECFQNRTMAFMILGNNCTRHCKFCGITKADPQGLVSNESQKIVEAAKKLKIQHVVITSVTRDDIEDGGAKQFLEVTELIKRDIPQATIEILTPDLKGKEQSWKVLLKAPVNVFNHNLETVPRLYNLLRPEAEYLRSLKMLEYFKKNSIFKIKSGLILGLGEEKEEVFRVLHDLKNIGCDLVTLGQYLRPSLKQVAVEKYLNPQEFKEYIKYGEGLDLKIFAGPWVRSSYQAQEVLSRIEV
ncbi:MAG: lipoyl synthase [Candidatus Margulisbacteria bacterium]|nr:lipoyl synthase [Candidatus Margulisiibacteriota bacterium]